MYKRLTSLSQNQSFFLFGPRGSGKTTLLKYFFASTKKKALWLNLLEPKTVFELSQNPDSLLERWRIEKPEWVVIDEVQKIPRILDVVHNGIEKHKIKFALTGSSSRKLKRDSVNLLAGRAASFLLSPLSAIELKDDFDIKKALAVGLLPKYWSQENPLPQKEIYRSLYSYIQTYLKEEVAAEQLVRNLDPFRRFLVCAAQSNGKIINYSHIETDAGVSHSQAERHFEILCDTLIGRYLEPYHSSVRKRQSKKSKFYFFDTGVVRTLQNFAEEKLIESTYEYGNLFETFLINEFFKLKESLEKRWQFSYLRTQNDVEIDLVIEKPRSKPILIEIKSGNRVSRKDVKSLKSFENDFKGSTFYLLSNQKAGQEIDGVRCLYWLDGLKEIFDL